MDNHTTVEGDFVPHLRDDFALKDVNASAIVWSPNRPSPFVLDPVARVMLDIVDGQASVRDLVHDVCDVVGIPESAAATQVNRAVALFYEAGILTASGGEPVATPGTEVFAAPPNT